MKDNIYNNSGTWNMHDINNIDNSININNYNCRINLKNRNNHKEYEYDVFCLFKSKTKSKFKKHIRVTCINIHSSNMFISDHVHIDFPEEFYDRYYDHSLMKIKAIVQKYTRVNGTEDFGLRVTKIISANNNIGLYGSQFGFNKVSVKSQDQYDFLKHITFTEFSHEYLVEILSDQIGYFEGKLSNVNQLYSGFVSNMILTYYFANTRKSELEDKALYFHNISTDVIMDLIKLFSDLIYKINIGKIFMWRHLIQEVNLVCNVFQGINKPIEKINKKGQEENDELNNNINKFAEKIESKETKKIFDKIRLRNKDFEYEYPEDIQLFNEKMNEYVVLYFYNKRYIKPEQYYENWKDDYEI